MIDSRRSNAYTGLDKARTNNSAQHNEPIATYGRVRPVCSAVCDNDPVCNNEPVFETFVTYFVRSISRSALK